MPRCAVLTYQTPAGNAPVDEYIAGLEGTAAIKVAALVKLLEALGYELRLPHSRSGMSELACGCSTYCRQSSCSARRHDQKA